MKNNEMLIRNEEKFLTSDLGEDAVLMNLENGDYIGLSPVANDIWKLFEKETMVSDVIAQLQEAYEVEQDKCETETLSCIKDMVEKKLLIHS